MQPIKDDRSFLKLLLLSIITLGIYEFWHLHHWTKDINTLCKDDGKNNEGVLLYILFGLLNLNLKNCTDTLCKIIGFFCLFELCLGCIGVIFYTLIYYLYFFQFCKI